MARYRLQPRQVEAEQWFPDKGLEGVETQHPQICFSEKGHHFYLDAMGHPRDWRMADAWLPVDLNVPKEAGQVLPFAFWNLRCGESKLATPDDPLVQRYLQHMGWPHLPKPYGLFTSNNKRTAIMPGDWLIQLPEDWWATEVAGTKIVCGDEEFKLIYEPAERLHESS